MKSIVIKENNPGRLRIQFGDSIIDLERDSEAIILTNVGKPKKEGDSYVAAITGEDEPEPEPEPSAGGAGVGETTSVGEHVTVVKKDKEGRVTQIADSRPFISGILSRLFVVAGEPR